MVGLAWAVGAISVAGADPHTSRGAIGEDQRACTPRRSQPCRLAFDRGRNGSRGARAIRDGCRPANRRLWVSMSGRVASRPRPARWWLPRPASRLGRRTRADQGRRLGDRPECMRDEVHTQPHASTDGDLPEDAQHGDGSDARKEAASDAGIHAAGTASSSCRHPARAALVHTGSCGVATTAV